MRNDVVLPRGQHCNENLPARCEISSDISTGVTGEAGVGGTGCEAVALAGVRVLGVTVARTGVVTGARRVVIVTAEIGTRVGGVGVRLVLETSAADGVATKHSSKLYFKILQTGCVAVTVV